MKFPRITFGVLLAVLIAFVPARAEWLGKEGDDPHARHRAMQEMGERGDTAFVNVTLHDEELLNREGKKVRFVSDVIGEKLVAATFIYTNCTTICPVYQAIFADLQTMLGDRLGKDVVLITISLDPSRDIPARMKIEAEKWNAKPGWVHLTGQKRKMDKVLQGLDAYFADFTQHPPMALVGDGKTNKWKRYNGFPKPGELMAMIDEFKMARGGGHHGERAESGEQERVGNHETHQGMHHEMGHEGEHEKHQGGHNEAEQEKHQLMHQGGHQESKATGSMQSTEGPSSRNSENPDTRKNLITPGEEQKPEEAVSNEERARNYFTDLPVTDQDGNRLRFYSDVLKDRVVLITMYYTDCGLACPVTMQKLKDVEAVLGDRVGKDIFFVGLSVDSGNDSPHMVKEFLEEYGCYRKGWIFLTGEKKAVDHLIYKLGQHRSNIEFHSTLFIIGNVKTGHWAKLNPTYPPIAIAEKLKWLAEEG